MRQYLAEAPTARIVAPSLTFSDRLTLHRGSRTIEVRDLGPGNTLGDAVVLLPKRKVQRMLQYISVQTAAAVARGDSLEQVRKSVDLTAFRTDFAHGSPLLGVFFSQFVAGPAIAQGFTEAKGKLSAPSPR